MIPKFIHRIWLGPEPIPATAERYWVGFQRLHPGFEFRTWTDAEDYSWLRNKAQFDQATTWTSRSDVLRFELLARFGGIYVDVDVEPLKSYEPLLGESAFAGFEDARAICGAVMGAEPEHPAVLALVESLPQWVAGRPNAKPHEWAGPTFLTAQWFGREDVTLLDPPAFYPIHWSSRRKLARYRPETYSVHHWEKNWALTSPPTVSILMAWTDKDDAWRSGVKDWVERYWRTHLPDAEFLIGTDGNRELFNRSACFNDAARRATGDVLFTVDADCVVDPNVVKRAAELIASQRAWAVPWYTNYRLTQQQTEAVLTEVPESFVSPDPPPARWFEGREIGVGMRFAGFCGLIPRQAWELVGGMDERFCGWGSEDIGFMLALDTLWGPHLVPKSGALHLWHERPMSMGSMSPDLEAKYWGAAGDPAAMATLIGSGVSEPSTGVQAPNGWAISKPPKPDSVRLRFLSGFTPPVKGRKLSVLVAFRDVDGSRTRLWDFIRQRLERLLPDAEIVVGTDDGIDPFHKTLALNRAAAQASGDVFYILDADSWVSERSVREAMDSGLPFVKPWSIKYKLGTKATERILGLGADWDGILTDSDRRDLEHRGGFPPAPPLVVTREAFETVGGLDERFRGWGNEDVAFWTALRALYGNPKTLRGDCIHLNHSRIGRSGHDSWAGQDGSEPNATLITEYRRAARSAVAMRALIEGRKVKEMA